MLLYRPQWSNLIALTRQFRTLLFAVVTTFGAIVSVSCADSTEPADTAEPGTFTLSVRGPITLDLEGFAFPTPSNANGLLEDIQMISVTPYHGYTLIITFAPPVTIAGGTRSVGPNSSIAARFTIFDRGNRVYLEISDARSGTLTVDQCTVWLRCPGTFTGQFVLSTDSMPATITASFDARRRLE